MQKSTLGVTALLTSAVILSGCSDDFKDQAQSAIDNTTNLLSEKADQVMSKVNEKVDQAIDSVIDSIKAKLSDAIKSKVDEWLDQNLPGQNPETDDDYAALIEQNAELQALLEAQTGSGSSN